ncbi:hypothetical protein CIK06_08880 [Plantactinospora sp. KBS50]|nr:hypothetical protein CIK06_08880 [Plantactinospora sp. KBS50]
MQPYAPSYRAGRIRLRAPVPSAAVQRNAASGVIAASPRRSARNASVTTSTGSIALTMSATSAADR